MTTAPTDRDPGDALAVTALARALRDVVVAGDHLRRIIAAREGVGLSEFIVISQLYFGGPCGPSALTRDLGMTPGSMTVLLDRLESMGLVNRSAHPTDRRRQVVTLTRKGSVYHHEAFETFTGYVAHAYHSIDGLDAELMVQFLDATVAGLRAETDAV
jgi:DNA-binding MarR family transcriptional regulator